LRLRRHTHLRTPLSYSVPMSELVFEVTQESDGGFVAEALGEDIFTQGDTWEELKANVQDVVKAFYFEGEKPTHVRLHLGGMKSSLSRENSSQCLRPRPC